MADNMDLVIRMILNAADFMAGLDEEQAKLDEIDAKHINDKSFKVDADDADATVKVDGIEEKHIGNKNFNIDADTADADAKIDTLKAKIDALPDRKTIHVHYETDGNGPGGTGHGSSGGMDGGIGALGSSIMTALPMISPLLATATGGVMGLASAFAAAGAGAVGFGAVATPTIAKVITAANGGKNAMKGLDTQQRQAVGSLKSFQSFWNSFTSSFQRPVLSAFTTSLHVLQTVLGALRPAISGAANAFNGLLRDLQRSLGTPPVKAFFDYLGHMAGPMITAFGHIAGNVMLGVMNLLRAFGPLATQMVSGLVRMSAAFAQWSSRISSSKGFQQFIQYVRANGPVVMSIIGNLVSAIGHIVVALAPMGAAMLRTVQSFTQWLSAMTKAHPGLVQLAAGIVASIGAFKLMSPAISAVRTALGRLPGVVTVVTHLITALAHGGLSEVIRYLTMCFPAFRTFATVASTAFSVVGRAMTLMMGPWGILIAAVIAGVVLLITHWNQVSSWVQQHFGVSIPGVLRSLGSIFRSVWDGIRNAVVSAWNYIEPTIMSGVRSVMSFWNQAWPLIKQVFTEVWTEIRPIVQSVFAIWQGEFQVFFGIIKAIWGPFWSTIGSVLKTAWDLMSGVIRIAWDIIKGVVLTGLDLLTGHWGAAWNNIKSMFSNVWNDIKGTMGNLIGDAFNFGKNFVNMIASGITGAIGSVINAVSGVAGKIKSFLGFHSPAEEGPGADADVWAPNLMRMFTQGVVKGTPNLQSALTKAITPPNTVINPNINRLVNGLSGPASSASAASAVGGSFVVQGPLVKVEHMDARNQQDIQYLQQQLYNAEASVRRAKGVKGV